ncbi:PepSY-associated TM helix domain-containing protein [Sphingomonas paeninsulae]|uniref:PepSY-associated TM helix domain-containing protein n=1 Tax=Sphingomonas paeninsulae TaxID=2319844 RepID=UPI001EF02E76|nr:PepSY domain-containing protein [Sphingomonas paeninsulae]
MRCWPTYDTIWRWHFYAGLFCIPFVLWLSLTGSIYAFRPQIERFIDRPYAHLNVIHPATAAAQAEAAVREVPGSELLRYELPLTPDQAAQVIVGKGGTETRVYVHPQTLQILKTVVEDDRLMRTIFRLHGELLIGNTGSYIVELAASWTIVMIVSGLFLWWPRGGGLGGIVYPRLRSGGRRFWRDIHGVTGFWVSFFALFLLLSGLPWAVSWGGYFKAVRTVVEGGSVKQDWSTGTPVSEHAGHGGMAMAHPVISYAALDRMVATVGPLALAPPVLISPPAGAGQPWAAKSDAADRPLRIDLTLDPETGAILSRKDFAQRRLIDRIMGYGIAVHEGQLFGIANQLVNVATAGGLILLSVSSVILWWRRRPENTLGAPPARGRKGLAMGFFGVLLALGILLPLFGISMLVVVGMERLVLRRIPGLGGGWE